MRTTKLFVITAVFFSASICRAAIVQCPAFTTSDSLATTWPSCAYLLTVNPNLSITVTADTALLARLTLDPGDPLALDLEDIYVGVLNNSGRTIASIHLFSDPAGWLEDDGTSAAIDDEIFDFDGDFGLKFLAGGTGYEGPNIFFSGITCLNLGGPNTNCNDGTVNFVGGLAAGGATYFALEGGAQQLDGQSIPLSGTATPSQSSAVPEPSSWLLLASGLLGLGFIARRNFRP